MATVTITNGFPDRNSSKPTGALLVGVVIEGTIKAGDVLLLDDGNEVPIKGVEYIQYEDPEGAHVALSVDHADVSSRLFGMTFIARAK